MVATQVLICTQTQSCFPASSIHSANHFSPPPHAIYNNPSPRLHTQPFLPLSTALTAPRAPTRRPRRPHYLRAHARKIPSLPTHNPTSIRRPRPAPTRIHHVLGTVAAIPHRGPKPTHPPLARQAPVVSPDMISRQLEPRVHVRPQGVLVVVRPVVETPATYSFVVPRGAHGEGQCVFR